jgi:hypothetical protein
MSSATISAAAQRFARSSLVSTGMVGSLVKSKSLAPATRVRPPISRADARFEERQGASQSEGIGAQLKMMTTGGALRRDAGRPRGAIHRAELICCAPRA